MRRLFFPVLMGVTGCAVLLWLGTWQLQRLDWKLDLLAMMDARIAQDPVPLPDNPDYHTQNYLSVRMTGTAVGPEHRVFTSGTALGIGYRIITAFETTDGRRVLLDHGLLPEDRKAEPPLPQVDVVNEVTGNLIWPDDKTSSTPDPDLASNLWYARDVAAMAEVLQTEETMVVLRTASHPDPRLTPLPVDTRGIKNDHREYAITWFLLALVWAVMTLYLIYRIRRDEN